MKIERFKLVVNIRKPNETSKIKPIKMRASSEEDGLTLSILKDSRTFWVFIILPLSYFEVTFQEL